MPFHDLPWLFDADQAISSHLNLIWVRPNRNACLLGQLLHAKCFFWKRCPSPWSLEKALRTKSDRPRASVSNQSSLIWTYLNLFHHVSSCFIQFVSNLFHPFFLDTLVPDWTVINIHNTPMHGTRTQTLKTLHLRMGCTCCARAMTSPNKNSTKAKKWKTEQCPVPCQSHSNSSRQRPKPRVEDLDPICIHPKISWNSFFRGMYIDKRNAPRINESHVLVHSITAFMLRWKRWKPV